MVASLISKSLNYLLCYQFSSYLDAAAFAKAKINNSGVLVSISNPPICCTMTNCVILRSSDTPRLSGWMVCVFYN